MRPFRSGGSLGSRRGSAIQSLLPSGLFWLLAVTLPGCGGDRPGEGVSQDTVHLEVPAPDHEPELRPDPDPSALTLEEIGDPPEAHDLPDAPLHLIHRTWAPEREVGIGALRFLDHFLSGAGPAPEPLAVLEAPDPGAPVAALLGLGPGGFRLQVQEEGLVAGLLGIAYEELAFPLVEIDPGGRWLRVVYAVDGEGASRTSWVDREAWPVEVVLWEEWLAERHLFFLDPDDVAFYDGPEGGEVEVELEPSGGTYRFDYEMLPARVDGGWMEVEVTSPGSCSGDPPAAELPRMWIRWRNDEGRPLVWYPTGGC